MEKNCVRNSNIELLRIILMMMILILHYNYENIGGAFSVLTKSNFNFYVQYLGESAFAISVNCFVIITGYFNINEKSFKARKIVDLIVLTLGYNLVLYFLSVILKHQTLNLHKFLEYMVQPKWFVVIYIAIYAIAPFINIMIRNINKSTYKLLLTISIILFSIYPSIVNNSNLTTTNEKGYGVIHFVLLYLVGGYIRKYSECKKSKIYYLSIYISLTLIIFGISLLTKKVWDYNNILILASSVVFYIIFLKVNIKSRTINYISRSTLAVFIIHTDSAIIPSIWKLFNIKELCLGNLLIPNEIITVICMFLICTIIDMIRRIVFKYSVDKLLDKIKFVNFTYEIQ